MAEITSSKNLNQVEVSNVQYSPTTVLLSADTTITPQTHSGRVLAVTDVGGGGVTFTVDAPKTAGIHYKFVYAGENAIQGAVGIDCKAGNLIHGAIHELSSDANSAAVAIRPNGTSEKQLNISANALAFEINLVSNSSNQWYIWGKIVGPNPSTLV